MKPTPQLTAPDPARQQGQHRHNNRAPAVNPWLGDPATRPGIAGTAYDTAWVAGVPGLHNPQSPRFPTAFQWLLDHQWPDGSWGGAVRYEHDRILSTLAALTALARFGRQQARAQAAIHAGTRYLWQHGHRLAHEPMELVGFELLLPTLVARAQQEGITVPPHLDIYGPQRAEKLRLIPPALLYSPQVTVVHSLEFLGADADPDRLATAQGANGSIGNAPAATAFFLEQRSDPRAQAYLETCLARDGGTTAPVLHPCELFELLWAAYHLHLAGVPAARLLTMAEQRALQSALQAGGVSLSPSFPIPDADDTAVALLLLQHLGEAVDPGVLQAFMTRNGDFASFPYERHGSVGVNLHVLHALLRVPGYPEQPRVVNHLVDYLMAQQIDQLYWLDKWHISPYYATAHALLVLQELPAAQAARLQPRLERTREWLRQTQNADGSWGFYGEPTAEESAYAVLALASGAPDQRTAQDEQQCATAIRYLKRSTGNAGRANDASMPSLWIDKCLYTPTLVVQAVIEAAHMAVGASARSRPRWSNRRATPDQLVPEGLYA